MPSCDLHCVLQMPPLLAMMLSPLSPGLWDRITCWGMSCPQALLGKPIHFPNEPWKVSVQNNPSLWAAKIPEFSWVNSPN